MARARRWITSHCTARGWRVGGQFHLSLFARLTYNALGIRLSSTSSRGEGIRRERVPGSSDDVAGTPTDYLDLASTTNELAIITPYEVTFRCFTPELAGVLAGFARSPYGLLVKAINSEAAPASAFADVAAAAPIYYQQPAVAPQPYPRPGVGEEGGRPGAGFANRYGGAGAGGYRSPYAQTAPVAAPVAQPLAASLGSKSGLQPFLKEKELRITMLIHVVKLLPAQK